MAELTVDQTRKMETSFASDKKNLLAQRAAATNGLLKAAEDQFVLARNKNPYSTDLTSDGGPIRSIPAAAGCSPASTSFASCWARS